MMEARWVVWFIMQKIGQFTNKSYYCGNLDTQIVNKVENNSNSRKYFQFQSSSRKSALLSAAKKAKLKCNPSRVRFAESVDINGSPLNVSLTSLSSIELIIPILKAMSFVPNSKVNIKLLSVKSKQILQYCKQQQRAVLYCTVLYCTQQQRAVLEVITFIT